MAPSWRRYTVVAAALLVAVTACSSEGADDEPPTPSDQPTTAGAGMDMDPGFGAADLPDDFPPQLLPSSFTAGMFTELGSVRSVAFESSSSFDDVVTEYTAKAGEEPIVVLGDVRLASWTVDSWAVTVFEGTPTLIGFTATE